MDDDKDRFTALYDRYRPRVWAYAASRVGGQAADEVVSETFTVAWRRFADMPSATLPWLLGVARNVIRESVRAQVRRDSLAAELRRWTEAAERDRRRRRGGRPDRGATRPRGAVRRRP